MGAANGTIIRVQSLFCYVVLFQILMYSASTLADASTRNYSVHAGLYGYAPYFMVDRSGEDIIFTGIAHDFLDLFEQQHTDYERTNVLLSRKRANAMMAEGPIFDIMLHSPLFVPAEILKHYQFTNTVFHSKDVVITRRDQNFEYKKPADLFAKSVGAIRGYSYGEFDQLFKQKLINDVRVDAHTQAIGMLDKKRVDAYLGNIFVSAYYLRTMGLDPADFVFSKVAMYEFELAFLVNRRKPLLVERLNLFIDKVISDGTLEKIVKRYLD